MIISRVLAPSLLLVSCGVFARVQFDTRVDLKNSKEYGNHSAEMTFQLDLQDPLYEYNNDTIRLMA